MADAHLLQSYPCFTSMHGVARKGWSAVAAQPIAQGKFVCQYVGELISTAEAKRRLAVYDRQKAPRTGHALLVRAIPGLL